MEKTLFSILSEISATYDDLYSLEMLMEKELMVEVEKHDGVFRVAQSQCYYGGCKFNFRTFNSEYEAYKNAYIRTLLLKARKLANKGSSTHVVDIHKECPKLSECRGY